MIHVPTETWAHLAFDLAAWDAGMVLSVALSRWRWKSWKANRPPPV